MSNSVIMEIELKSFSLIGSGEGSALIDSDVVFLKNGFLVIPGRRIKGLLRESYQEVLEMQFQTNGNYKKDVEDKVFKLFGKEDSSTTSAKLYIGNFFIKDWATVKAEFLTVKSIDKYAFAPDSIKKYFTREIPQTAVDEDGIAKDKSLRNYRVLKHGLLFGGNITILSKLDSEEIRNLDWAIKNLRAAGVRRNRGFGKIKCLIGEGSLAIANYQIQTPYKSAKESIHDIAALDVVITATSPLILSLQQGEQNTVFTEKHISGNRLRGMLAYEYVKRVKAGAFAGAHGDDDFYNIFLSGKLRFEASYPEGSRPLPLNIHAYKGRELDAINVFEKSKDDIDVTKSVGGFGSYTNGLTKQTVPSSFNFHNSRVDRQAGKSTEDNPGIFYYESIDDGMKFNGTISGSDGDALRKLYEVLGSTFVSSLGKSKSAQYGQVEVTLEPITESDKVSIDVNEYLLVAESPIIVYNDFGFPEPNADNLNRILSNYGIEFSPDTQASVRIGWSEQMNTTWISKSGKIPVFKEGSCFVVRIRDIVRAADLLKSGLGEYCHLGFGKIKLEPYDAFPQSFKQPNATSSKESAVDDNYIPSNAILSSILAEHRKEKVALMLREKAMEKSKNYNNKVSSNLVSRLLAITEQSGTEADFKATIAQMDGKSAAKALQNIHEWEDLLTAKVPRVTSKDEDEPWENKKLYWCTVFITARKLKKLKDA